MPMVLNTKANGKMISNTVKEERLGKMVVNTMVTTSIPRNKEEVLTPGLMETNILEIGMIMPSTDTVFTFGQMAEFIAENGKTI
jgi:hypothetical protein